MRWLVASAIAVAGCGRIGFPPATDGAVELGPFGTPMIITAVSTLGGDEEEPTFTADQLELVFRRRSPNPTSDLFVSLRTTVTEPWGLPTAIAELNTPAAEYASGISPDGLTLWFSSDRAGGLGGPDIWVSTRGNRGATWSMPVTVPSLNSTADDSSPAVSADGSVMIFNSRRANVLADIYQAARATPITWMPPQPIAELNTPTTNECCARLWDASRRIVFAVNRGTGSNFDLWTASRPTVDDPFTDLVELVELNSPADDFDPWISEDGHYLVFGSSRSGNHEIYEASR